jgi:porphobilinogen synthase
MRRLRRTPALRRLVQETHVVPSQLIWPLFVVHGAGVRRPVEAMPGVAQLSVEELVKERAHRWDWRHHSVGIPAMKDATGSEAHDEQDAAGHSG